MKLILNVTFLIFIIFNIAACTGGGSSTLSIQGKGSPERLE
tara:strand:- start:792 stop:914 length:123 start_codon:yes stop_codon:yes gene_type:complete